MDLEELVEGPLEHVRGVLNSLRFTDKKTREASQLPGNEQLCKSMVDKIVWLHLKANCGVFCSGGCGYILPDDGVPVAISKDGHEFSKLLESQYGIHPGDSEKDRVGKYVGMQCAAEGVHTEVLVASHYDRSTNIAYFAEQRGKLLRVTKDRVERVPNGTDGKLFLFPEDYEPFTVDLDRLPVVGNCLGESLKRELDDLVFGGAKFSKGQLTGEEKKMLLMAYLLVLFLPGYMRNKLILLMLGASGSGKTFLLRVFGMILHGSKFDVTACPKNVEDLELKLVNNSFVAFDDSEALTTEARSVLRQAATGGVVQRRELYTTSRQVTFPFRAVFAFSTVKSPFGNGEEEANRQLCLTLQPREGFIEEEKLVGAVLASRSILMAEMMERVRMTLAALDAQKDYSPVVTMRLAGFATFILRIARHEGWEEQAWLMLKAWQAEQQNRVFEDNELADTLISWFRTDKFISGTVLSAGKLMDALKPHVTGKPSWFDNGKRLAGLLQRSQGAFGERFGLALGTDRHTKTTTYSFTPDATWLAELRASAAQQAFEMSEVA